MGGEPPNMFLFGEKLFCSLIKALFDSSEEWEFSSPARFDNILS